MAISGAESTADTTNDAQAAIDTLLARRGPGKTICPSEAARSLASDGEWRAAMPGIHAAVDRMLARGDIAISWKGEIMAQRVGPYRICRANNSGVGA